MSRQQLGLDTKSPIAEVAAGVPRRARVEDGSAYIRMFVLVNDVVFSTRLHGEHARALDFFQAKPRRGLAPVSVTREFLGHAGTAAW